MPRNSEPLSNVDAAWLRMDEPTTMMMITGVLTFKKPINLDHLQAVLEHRWLKFDRFRQRLVRPSMPGAKAYWETDPYFDLRSHFHRIALPAPGNQQALQRMVGELMSTPLDFSKPLWQFHLVENFGEGSALIARIHHSIADGLALVYVLLSLTDMSPEAPWPEPSSEEDEEEENGLFGGFLGTLFKQSRAAVNTAGNWTSGALRGGLGSVRDTNQALDYAQKGADVSYAASRLLLRSDDPATLFKGQLGVVKRGAWSKPLSLKDVKRIKNATRTTVNDVLVAAMAGALRRYMLDRGQTPVDFRATVPVNMRTPEEMGQLGNKFGLVFLSLPVSVPDPLGRLAEVHLRMTELKRSAEAGVILAALNVVGLSTSQIQDAVVSVLARKATAVLTNVPGPPIPLFLAGRQIEDIMFWVPQAGRLGMGISLLSYAGKVYAGVATDAKLVPDPEAIIAAFYEELELLLAVTGEEMLARPSSDGQTAKSKDDLTKIQGVTAETAQLLQQRGIIGFKQLAQSSPQALSRILQDAGPPHSELNPANWPAQARYLGSLR